VIRSDASVAGERGILLIYIYKAASSTKVPVPLVGKNDLLIPPFLTTGIAWSRGYFETLEHRELEPADMLGVHCFWSATQRAFIDEYENRLSERHDPCGEYGFTTLTGIDDKVSRALCIRLSPFVAEQLGPRSRRFYNSRLVALERDGVPRKRAEVEAMKDTVQQMGERVEDYAWPEPAE